MKGNNILLKILSFSVMFSIIINIFSILHITSRLISEIVYILILALTFFIHIMKLGIDKRSSIIKDVDDLLSSKLRIISRRLVIILIFAIWMLSLILVYIMR